MNHQIDDDPELAANSGTHDALTIPIHELLRPYRP